MLAPMDGPEKRISVRVEPELYDRVQEIAEERFEGKFSMAARAAFRLLVNESPSARTESDAPVELAKAS